MEKTSKGLKLADILTTIVIAVVFGVIYKVWGPLYEVVKVFGFQALMVIDIDEVARLDVAFDAVDFALENPRMALFEPFFPLPF